MNRCAWRITQCTHYESVTLRVSVCSMLFEAGICAELPNNDLSDLKDGCNALGSTTGLQPRKRRPWPRLRLCTRGTSV